MSGAPPAPSASREGRPRYLAVGHVTVDVLPGDERRAGGTALYSAVQAARLGLEATIVTRGRAAELEPLLAPFAGELELIVQPATATTTLATAGEGEQRRQRVLDWAGPIDLARLPGAEILHLAPVAAELSGAARGGWPFVGITPQGLARRWDGPGGEIFLESVGPGSAMLAGRCDAVVLSDRERAACAALLERAIAAGATVAVTAGAGATELLGRGGADEMLEFEPIAAPADDLGAGDVFAAAFFASLAAGDGRAEAARTAHAAAELRMLGIGPGAIAHAAEIRARAKQLAARRA
jgi:sugar/nucleoside kinase (ribokinase family)